MDDVRTSRGSRENRGVSIHSGQASNYVEYDHSQVLIGANNALVVAPGKSSGPEGSFGDFGNSDLDRKGDESTEEAAEEDIDDNETVYLTENYRAWERHYLKRLARRIHRLVCAELDRSEEALFMLFTTYDESLDGVVRGVEATRLLEAIEQATPGVIAADNGGQGELVASDGSISFVSLLEWFSGANGGAHRETSPGFGFTSLAVGLLGSGTLQVDGRLDALDWAGLRRNILGYRRLFLHVRQLQEDRALAQVREVEVAKGIEEAMPLYYGLLAKEFEGDAEHLFELLCQVDITGDMRLNTDEVKTLLCLLDADASEGDVRRYIAEINMADGPLSFASLVDWWDQARSVKNSLVAEKGAALIAKVRAQAAGEKISSLFAETAVQKRLNAAKQGGQLEIVREAYCRTLSELREYKMERDLRLAEQECAAL